MNALVHVAGWTLIHFLWQGAAAALATGTALGLTRRRSAHVRYLIACAGLAAALAMPAATAMLLLPAEPASAGISTADASTPTALPSSGVTRDAAVDTLNVSAAHAARRSGIRADDAIRGVVIFWIIGVALLLGRMAAGWWQVRELHQLALESPASGWQPACARIGSRLGLARIAHVVESVVVEVPTVVGWLRPVIILPVAAIAGLTPSQVEAILAHELAHIRRYDYLVNLCQTLAETLLFYHPGVWWMSSRIRAEREHCCDEIAVGICGDPIAYAEALTELESWRTASTLMAVAATGGSLIDRVRRILRVPGADQARSSNWVATLALTLLFTAGAGGFQRLPTIFSGVTARAAAVVSGSSGSTADTVEAQVSSVLAAPRAARAHAGVARTDAEVVGLRAPAPPDVPALPEPTDQVAVPAPPAPPTPPASLTPPVPPAPPTAPSATAPTVPPAPPTPPSAATSPAPPAPPAPPAASSGDHFSLSRDNGDWHVRWRNDGQFMDVQAHGDVVFNDDLTDVQTMADGGFLKIRDWTNVVPHTVEITSSGGQITRAYYVAGLSRPWDDEARRWLAGQISLLVRRSGFGAAARTKSILEKHGVAGVLDEVDRLEGDYVRRVYLQALLDQHRFDAAGVRPVLEKIDQRMTSDFDRRQLLTAIADDVPLDARDASVYMRVVASMKSDFDRRQALSAILAKKPLAPGVADLALKSTEGMHSDFDRRQVLHAALAGGASVERAGAVLPAIASMRSAFDKREVLLDLIHTGSLNTAAQRGVLQAVDGIGSDFDTRTVLTAFARQYKVDPATRDDYFAAVKSMHSDFDRAESLLILVRSGAVDAAIRPAFVETARSLRSTFDQDRVLAALVRAEGPAK